ncbi:MAG: PilZ domain-containing protein [Syntrophomonadaceae bacterium]|nr:PilZ domain-containing protein [Syntrophomonadaceae bacterium]
MKKNILTIGLFINLLLILTAVFLLAPEVYALTWDDFTKSMNEAFSQKNIFTVNNLVFLIIVLIIACGLIMIIRYDTVRTDRIRRQAYQEFQQDLLAKKELLKSSNNRSWFRIPMQMEFKWQRWPIEDGIKPRKYTGLAHDISGGGMLFQTTESLKPDEQIKLWIKIDDTPLELTAEVVRTQEKLEEDKTINLIGVKFINIREGIRDKIIAWVLRCQTELMVENEEVDNEEPTNIVEENVIIDNEDNIEEENIINKDEAPSLSPNDDIDDKNIITDLFTHSNINISGVIKENNIDLSVILENEEPIKLKAQILNTVHNESDSTIITLKINKEVKE